MPRLPRRRIAVAVAALVIGGLVGPSGAATRAATPALFSVGAAVRDIAPPVPVYPGGYGTFAGNTGLTKTYSPLQVRAFYVSNGHSAVAMASVDSQAWFAAVQQGPWGISDARADAADAINAAHSGPTVSASDLLVQSTHSHSAPTVEGIWGPVPDRYLELVHHQTVAALVAAARAAQPAHLQVGAISNHDIGDVTIADDTLAGWDIDAQISAIRATDPNSGRTIATYVSIPEHPVTINGQARKVLGADYFAPLRTDLEALLGGTVVAGPATLGRQEPPVQTTDYTQLAFYARALTGLVSRALATAHPVTDPTIAASETTVEVPGTNAAILGLVYAWQAPEPARTQAAQAATLYPADRSLAPPYLVGNTVGTPLTALRIGKTLLLSMPGEPYPEVVQAIRDAVKGPDLVIALSKGQDDLGYFMPAWAYAYGVALNTDHPVFSVAPQMGDEVAATDGQLATDLGFTDTLPPGSLPAPHDFSAAFKPGLQALAASAAGDAGPDGRYHPQLEAIYNTATYNGSPNSGGVHWDFGDGTKATTGYLLTATGPQGRSFVDHGFRPGKHTVTVTATSAAGDTATWTTQILAFPQLRARATSTTHGGTTTLVAHVVGGDGHLLAARWLRDGRVLGSGTSLSLPAAQASGVRLEVVDGTGTTARS
jgi:hypothetical protein